MTKECWLWTRKVEIPSEKGAGEQVVQEVLAQLQQYKWDERDIFAVHLSLEEALVNAIKHGNGFNVAKAVRVVCNVSQDRIRIVITDEGEGFDPEAVPDPTEEENLERPCGRGVHLMRNFMSEVQFNAAGNSVVMEKERAT